LYSDGVDRSDGIRVTERTPRKTCWGGVKEGVRSFRLSWEDAQIGNKQRR